MRAAILATLALGCTVHPLAYRCSSDVQCGANGLCIEGSCAFPAASCQSGYQFDSTATRGRASQCADELPDLSGETDSDMGSDMGERPDLAEVLICNPSSVYCVGANLRHCAADGLSSTLIETCSTPEICAMSGLGGCGSPFCSVGDINCVGAQLQTCNAGRTGWVDVEMCATAQLCGLSTATGCMAPACAPTEVKCVSGTSFQNCNAGRTAFVTVDTCVTSELCAISTGSTCTPPACAVNEKRCGGAGNNTVQMCNSGRTGFTDVGPCTAPRTCGGGGTAGVCGGCSGSLPGPTMVNVGTYCIDSTEVTVTQYNAFVSAGVTTSGQPSGICDFNTSWTTASQGTCNYNSGATGTLPATCVDWCDSYAYCRWAGKRMCGKIGGGSATYGMPTSTSSQWYMVCSNGGTTAEPYGVYTSGTCNCTYTGHQAVLASVATYPGCRGPNPPNSGVYDMSGNVAEWEDACQSITGTWFCGSRGGSINVTNEDSTQFRCDTGDFWPAYVTSPGYGIRCCAD